MGVPEGKIFLAPYTVDNERFASESHLTPADRLAWRARFGIPADPPAILYAAKFTRRKHPDHLLEAVHRLRARTTESFSLVLCGAGEIEADLRSFCAAQALDNVVFTGFVNQGELPKLYGACDVFVLPSENEPWGLAVNEAMCAGMPIVVSREVGCVADLVEPGVNGFTPEAGDIEALAEALLKLVIDAPLRARQGAASRERIRTWSYKECADAFQAALAGTRP
jgi:glycosyltransferase involved in cell wall biosynthesis